MGGREGHVVLGMVFVLVGLWHFYNQIKTHTTTSRTKTLFKSLTWYPTKFCRHLELYLILLGTTVFSIKELSLAPFDTDGTFKANHLHHIEHASIATAFSLHALFAILLDKFKFKPKPHDYSNNNNNNNNNNIDNNNNDVGHWLVAMAFAQELLLFHFHTTDHVGLEGQYHYLLQQLIFICLVFTLLSLWLPKSFMVCYIRSLSVIFQGLWLIVMGYMLWTPGFAPKGCSYTKDKDSGRDLIKCDGHDSLHRAKALVNILFSWVVIGMMGFGVSFYWGVSKVFEVNDDEFIEVCTSDDLET